MAKEIVNEHDKMIVEQQMKFSVMKLYYDPKEIILTPKPLAFILLRMKNKQFHEINCLFVGISHLFIKQIHLQHGLLTRMKIQQ